jgi:mannose-6-phosphate isomerase-like protein (cupin superfamily)
VSRTRALPVYVCLLAAVWLAARGLAAADAPAPPPVLDAYFAERLILPLAELAARVPLARDQDFRIEELGRSAHTSHHVGAIRGAERPHRHDHHDQWVMIVRGHGTMRIGDETRPLGEGSVVFVPQGVVHAFTNAGPEPAISLLVYAPPFDGKDRIQVP